MIRLRPSSPLFRAVLAGSVLSCLAPLAHAQRGRSAADRALVRAQTRAVGAEEAVRRGDAAVIRLDYDGAVREYRAAVEAINLAPATTALRTEALAKFQNASIELANERIVEGRYVDAETVLKVLLRPEYDPGYKPALTLLQQLEDPEHFNQTVGPKFIERVNQVKHLFIEAQGFYDSARWDLAYKRYNQILLLDPYNDAARLGQERVSQQKLRHYDRASYPSARAKLLSDVASGWDMPVPKRGAMGRIDQRAGGLPGSEDTGDITRKLQKITIPNIEFRSTTVSDAIEFLRQESKRLDTETADPDARGVNIFLKLPAAGARIAPVAPAGEVSIPGVEGGTVAPAPAPVSGSANTRITLTMSRLPLLEALRYVASQAGLKVKVERYAVAIVPNSESVDELVTAEFRVSPTFISNSTSGGGPSVLDLGATTAGNGGGGARDVTNVGGVTITKQDAKTFLEASGVTFPPGASATYIAATSKLVVRNTQANVDLIEALVNESQVVIKQVEISSKFIEITQQNLKELSFDWTLGQFNLPGSGKSFVGGGTSGGGRSFTSTDFPFAAPGGNLVGNQPVTAGNRTGTFGISANAIDALLFGVGGGAAAPGILALAGPFSDPTFQVVMRALNQQKGVDLLSEPRVTTKSGQKATIEIIREFIYPTQFQPPQIPQNFNGGNNFNNNPVNGLLGGLGGGNSSQSFPVTPTTPTNFEKRNTGVTLEVEPVIGPDNYTIDLNLQPQVVEFDGFINYGSPIQTSNTNILGVSTPTVLTANAINQPVFDTRKISTSVTVYDGATVVLGGLVREDIQKVNDKVPILGDVPLVGRLFRSKIDQNIKRNLIIFVTAKLVTPDGLLFKDNEEEEEQIQLLNGPDYVTTPTYVETIPAKK